MFSGCQDALELLLGISLLGKEFIFSSKIHTSGCQDAPFSFTGSSLSWGRIWGSGGFFLLGLDVLSPSRWLILLVSN